ncbi:hypothetical protein B0J13DRAFT_437522 [Dactylonectria estremocensis]|uniref:RING-type domain-containing protein n=1 Tax=Dactylonectria estremocensis TaxID=1079267 RepID=A0A9P9JC65_9HYPO|nr:hypothetical protein B0J13DRAFT_437522 [Dactylonectria estremocensis]
MALLLYSLLACALTGVLALDDYDVISTAEKDVPEWAAISAMQLTLTNSNGKWSPLQFTVLPLTDSLGLNGTQTDRGVCESILHIIRIHGTMIAADSSNYNTLNDNTTVAYLSCDDDSSNSLIEPDKMLNGLMSLNPRPKAIVLYSTSKNWCSIAHQNELSYTSILSMADAAEASQALGFLNNTDTIKVSIMGNTTNDGTESSSDTGQNNPAVAMSILYSITGIITLLFAVIIVTGAVRAHRYPERYGPRRALPGRPRQSRAKGLARAVLETIPIVKFGNQTPAKPDPELDLDVVTNDGRDNTVQRTTSNVSDAQHTGLTPAPRADNDGASSATRDSPTPTPTSAPDGANENGDDNLGCSICTEDFRMGEDVRVLPCQHQYHPACVDPWLINVSGTCPLCRFDLRPGKGAKSQENTSGARSDLPPPLALEGVGNDEAQIPHHNRASRISDINRLREATVEEQMETLRRMRAEVNEAERQAPPDGESHGQSARFAAKLKERFRILTRTRAQTPEDRDC